MLVLCLDVASAGSVQSAGETDLLGTWDDVTPERERERVGYGDRALMPSISLTFDGSACTWQVRGGQTIRQSLFITVPAGQDRGIDFVTVSSSESAPCFGAEDCSLGAVKISVALANSLLHAARTQPNVPDLGTCVGR